MLFLTSKNVQRTCQQPAWWFQYQARTIYKEPCSLSNSTPSITKASPVSLLTSVSLHPKVACPMSSSHGHELCHCTRWQSTLPFLAWPQRVAVESPRCWTGCTLNAHLANGVSLPSGGKPLCTGLSKDMPLADPPVQLPFADSQSSSTWNLKSCKSNHFLMLDCLEVVCYHHIASTSTAYDCWLRHNMRPCPYMTVGMHNTRKDSRASASSEEKQLAAMSGE